MLLDLFPLIAAAMAVLSFSRLPARRHRGVGRQLSNAAPTKSPSRQISWHRRIV